MTLSVISELDLRYRNNFIHDENTPRDTEWISGYEYLSGGTTFTGRAVDLAVSVCEGLVKQLGYHASDVWLGYGINPRNEFKYAALVRTTDGVLELGRVDQGAYVNSYGLPYTAPRDALYSDIKYEQLFSFVSNSQIRVYDEEWPLNNGKIFFDLVVGNNANEVVDEYLKSYDEMLEKEAIQDKQPSSTCCPAAEQAPPQIVNFGEKLYGCAFNDLLFTIVTSLGIIALLSAIGYAMM